MLVVRSCSKNVRNELDISYWYYVTMENPHEKFWDRQIKEHKKRLFWYIEHGVYDQNLKAI